MATLTNINDERVVHVRADIPVLGSCSCEGEQAVDLRKDIGVHLHLRHPFREREHQFLIQAVLDDLDLLFRRGDFLLIRLQLVGDITFCRNERLFANPLRRHLVFERIANLQIVTEDIVIPDFKAGDACAFDLALLDLEQVVFSVRLDGAQFVQLCIHAARNNIRSSLC